MHRSRCGADTDCFASDSSASTRRSFDSSFRPLQPLGLFCFRCIPFSDQDALDFSETLRIARRAHGIRISERQAKNKKHRSPYPVTTARHAGASVRGEPCGQRSFLLSVSLAFCLPHCASSTMAYTT